MNRGMFLAIAAILLGVYAFANGRSTVAAQSVSTPRYSIVVADSEHQTPYTFLLDGGTGKTWYLCGEPSRLHGWCEVPVVATRPK